jgi:hypothetical protein
MMKRSPHAVFEVLAIFVVALLIRVVFNLSQEHRLCHFGDAFYFLTSGSQLLAALKSGMLTHLSELHTQATVGVQTMTSVSFIDRILIDGPVFPAYLAMVQTAIGLSPDAPHFDLYSLQLAISNSLLDSIACVLIYQSARLAFDRTSALIAGMLASFYPAAIVNTASCYSEPFSYFLLSAWIPLWFATQLRHLSRVQFSIIVFATGILSGMLMLAKPIFIALPPLCAALTLLMSLPQSIGKTLRNPVPVLMAILLAGLGSLLTFTPWLLFTGAVTGKSSIVVNRYPAFNFVMGNRLESDGWRQYPQPYVPAEMKNAVQIAKDDFQRAPIEYAAMQIRKATRLWAGSWNNFERSFFISAQAQDCVHQILLLAGALGLLIACGLKRHSRQFKASVLLATIALFHCIYMAFEPQARYAFSAMPCVIVLAGFALSFLMKRGSTTRIPLAIALTAGAVFIIGHRYVPTAIHTIYPLVRSHAAVFMDAALWVGTWSAVCILALKLATTTLSRATLLTGWLGVSIVLFASTSFEQSRFEVPLSLKNQAISRDIQIPQERLGNKYLLFDVQLSDSSAGISPPVAASINGAPLAMPMPWWQVSGDNSELVSALSVQAQGMGTSIQNFRQWWVCPIPAKLLKPGTNTVCITPTSSDSKVALMADYPLAYEGRTAWLPAFDKASWTKAFTTIFRNEPRLYDKIRVSEDLAAAAKTQSQPVPRLFLLDGGNSGTTASTSAALITAEKPVEASNPSSFALTAQAVPVPPAVRQGGYFRLTADARSLKRSTDAFATVTFTSDIDGKPVQWCSPWQPTHINTDKTWSHWAFSDRIPAAVLRGQNPTVSVTASPFPADLLFLNKKQALKRAISLKNVELEFIPAGLYPQPATEITLY